MARNTSLDSLSRNKYVIITAGVAMVAMIVLIFANAIGFNPAGNRRNTTKAELTMWGVWDESEFMREYAQEFKKQYPNVTINYTKQVPEGYEENLINALAAGRGPDIFAIQNTWLGKHQDKISAMPEGIMTIKEYRDRFVDFVSDDFVRGDQIYAFPLYTDNLALFYNKDAFATAGIPNPPETWSDLQADVRKLTKIDRFGNITQSGIALGTGENINRSPDILSLLILQSGGTISSQNGISFNQGVSINGVSISPGKQALEFYTDFANPRKAVYTWNQAQDYSVDAFYAGKTAMMLGYSYQVEAVKAKAPRLNFAVSPLPQIDPDTSKINFANYWAYSVSGQSSNKEIAYQFLKFLTEKENAQKYFLNTQRLSARRDLVETQSQDITYGVFASQIVQARTWPQPDNNQVDRILIDAIQNVNSGVLLPGDAITQAEQQINTVLKNL